MRFAKRNNKSDEKTLVTVISWSYASAINFNVNNIIVCVKLAGRFDNL